MNRAMHHLRSSQPPSWPDAGCGQTALTRREGRPLSYRSNTWGADVGAESTATSHRQGDCRSLMTSTEVAELGLEQGRPTVSGCMRPRVGAKAGRALSSQEGSEGTVHPG